MYKCKCHNIPSEGKFTVGNEYDWSYVIDGIYVIDDVGEKVDFNDWTMKPLRHKYKVRIVI